ncbi:hypothetical protein BaRGS_00018361 [Batillaria attramentaria]|uniref:IgGFc-binding protein N-terminal domain-containing protein n=1 Tax=Batillaria attramentaria TaxID=370345 RepID=A0ABD0KT55_9CAEN
MQNNALKSLKQNGERRRHDPINQRSLDMNTGHWEGGVLSWTILVFGTLMFVSPSSATNSSLPISARGTEFFLAFPRHTHTSGLTQELIISNPADTITTARVQFPQLPESTQCLTRVIPPGGWWRVELNETFHVGSSSREDKGIYVTSSGPVDVQVLAQQSGGKQAKGGYKALPREALSADYVVATHCVLNNCFSLIVVTENKTNMNISLRLQNGGQVTFEGVAYADDDVISTSGDAGHVIQVTCYRCDISGTRVQASRPVAVIAGGEFEQVGSTTSVKDMLVEQLLPWRAAGTRYVLGGDAISSSKTELVKIITGDVITFSYDGVTHTSSRPRQVFQFTRSSSAAVEILADDKVLVAQFIKPGGGDYVMVVPLPVSSWKTCYDVFVYGQDATDLHLVLFTPDTGTLPTALLQPSNGYLRVQTPGDCVSAPAACYPFSGYLYAYSSWKAWSIPIMSSCFTEGVTSPANMISEESVGVTTECPAASTTTTESVTTVSDATSTVLGTSQSQTSTVFGTSQGHTSTVLGTSQGQTSTVLGTSQGQTSTVLGTSQGQTSTVLGTSQGQTSTVLGTSQGQTSTVLGTSQGHTSTVLGTSQGDTSTVLGTSQGQPSTSNQETTYSVATVSDALSTDTTRVRSTTAESTTVEDTTLDLDSGSEQNTVDPEASSTTPLSSKTTKKLGQCPCNCATKTISKPEDLISTLATLQSDLRVNSKEQSLYKRKKTSAQDPRASSMRVGVTGVSFLAFVAGLLLSCDLAMPDDDYKFQSELTDAAKLRSERERKVPTESKTTTTTPTQRKDSD